MTIEVARKVADVVLYEGYVLYPYRASAQKNQVRWQFGVLVPQAYVDVDPSESWFVQTECLIEPRDDCTVRASIRFLQLQRRTVEEAEGTEGFRRVESLEVGETTHVTWDEVVEHETEAVFALTDLLSAEAVQPVEVPGGHEVEPIFGPSGAQAGRIVRERRPCSGVLRARAERMDGPFGVVKLRLRTENRTPFEGRAERDDALRVSLLSAHTLLSVAGGAFVSLMDPPEWARPIAESCDNIGTFPVLVGEPGARDVILSSRIILSDYPQIAPESPGDLFDATEIDEILTLRTMTLTDEEKREARATDERAAEIIDRVDAMPQEMMDRLHGAVRYLRDATKGPERVPTIASPPDAENPDRPPWWDPRADTSVSPGTDEVIVQGVPISKGSQIRLRPGSRRADAQDMFLAGRTATVQAVFFDVEGNVHLAVTLDDDEAADLRQAYGRFLYFAPDEVEPLDADPDREVRV